MTALALAPAELSVRQYGWALLTVAIVVVPTLWWLPLPVVATALGFLGACWWFTQKRGAVRVVPAWIRMGLVALLCGLILARYGTLLGRHAGASLLITMLALKAAECRTSRDVRLMVSIAFFVIVSGFLFEDSPLLVLYMLGASVVGFAAMEALEQRSGESSLLFARLGWRQVLMLLVVSLPLTLVLWLFFPRLSTPLWGTPEQIGRTGLSNRMSPGDITNLLTDDSVVVRVTFEGPLPPRDALYFRGATLWNYDGESWTGPTMGSMQLAPRPLEARADLRYSVYQEPTDKRWLFVLDRPSEVGRDSMWTRDQQLLSRDPIAAPISYTASSQLTGPWRPFRFYQRELQFATSLPFDFDPQSQALGRQLAQRHGDDHRAIVQAVLARFTTEAFFYSLSPPPVGRHRNDDFLFSTRAGFCEHYASAFAVVLRAAGVPTRVVLGYLGGVYNRSGGYLALRNSDAHAWNEVYLDGEWQRFDPTAAIAPERVSLEGGGQLVEDSSFWGGVGQRWDALGQYWRQFVVQFSALTQSQLLRSLGFRDANWESLGLLLGGLGALVSAFAAWLLWRHRPTLTRDPWLKAWVRLRRKLVAAGLSVPADAGPRDCAQAVHARWPGPVATATAALLARFELALYRARPTDPAAIRELGGHIRRLRLPRARVRRPGRAVQ